MNADKLLQNVLYVKNKKNDENLECIKFNWIEIWKKFGKDLSTTLSTAFVERRSSVSRVKIHLNSYNFSASEEW